MQEQEENLLKDAAARKLAEDDLAAKCLRRLVSFVASMFLEHFRSRASDAAKVRGW